MAIATTPGAPDIGPRSFDSTEPAKPGMTRRHFLGGLAASIGVSVVGVGAYKLHDFLQSKDDQAQANVSPQPTALGAEAQANADLLTEENVPQIELVDGRYGRPPALPVTTMSDPMEIAQSTRDMFTYGLNNYGNQPSFLGDYVYSDSESGRALLGDSEVYAQQLATRRSESSDNGLVDAWIVRSITGPEPDTSGGSFTVETVELQYAIPTNGNNVEISEHFMRTTFVKKNIDYGAVMPGLPPREIWVADFREEVQSPDIIARGNNPHIPR